MLRNAIRWTGFGAIVLAQLVSIAATCAAEPFRPSDDSQVLETLPRVLFSVADELSTLRQVLADEPNNLELATRLAEQYVQLGKQESDPRYYGYARAAIRPWWSSANAPPEVLKLRAKLKERDHQYDEAVDDLKQLLQSEPRDVQAWIELANIYRVQGKYGESRRACDALAEFTGKAQSMFCSIPLLAVTGQAEQAYDGLAEILPEARERWPGTVSWVLTMQADVARALGLEEQAERFYREGLDSNPLDLYLMRAYADYLLDHRRDHEALALLHEHTNDTGILLRAAIAAKRIGEQELATRWVAQLESRFEEIRLRGSEPHGRFESRCALELREDPERALSIALANWQEQKEVRDTRNVLEAAVAANETDQVQPVLEFLQQHDTEHAILQRLIQQLEDKQ